MDSKSAVLGLPSHIETVINRDTDHSRVCKFNDPKNSCLKDVIASIRAFIRPHVEESAWKGIADDFTMRIEPDTEGDRDSCLIAYRFQGPIVQWLSPICVDSAVVEVPRDNRSDTSIAHDDGALLWTHHVPIDLFLGAKVVLRPEERWSSSRKPLLVLTNGLPNARTCTLTMCFEALGGKCEGPIELSKETRKLHLAFKNAFVLWDRHNLPIIFT